MLEPSGMASMRLKGLVRKEALQILRDPSSLAIAFLMPVVLLFLFGYGVSLDAKHVPIALVVERPSAETAGLTGAFAGSEYFSPVFQPDQRRAEQAMVRGEVDAILVLQADFAEALQRQGGAPIQLIVNGVNANTARLVIGYVEGVWGGWLESRARARGGKLQVPVGMEPRIWFNSEVKSRNYLVPGLVAVIMTLIGALLTALVMAREWERGTMESLLVTPVSMGEIMLGKLLPYFALGMGGMALTVAVAVWGFEVPLRGSLWVLLSTSALFMLAALGMGLFISTIARSQFVAGQVAIIATFLPAFLLSGFIFDIGSMPAIVRVITHLIAARYYVAILQTVFLSGDVWRVILPNALALVLMATVFLGLTRLRSRKRLD